MTLKDDGRVSNRSKKKKHKMIKCDGCRHENDYDEMLLNDDIDKLGSSEFLYCEQCGNQIQVK